MFRTYLVSGCIFTIFRVIFEKCENARENVERLDTLVYYLANVFVGVDSCFLESIYNWQLCITGNR